MVELSPGDPAPSFKLPDHEGTPRSLDEFLGQPLVLFFYPGDFTPGCTREVCQFRDAGEDFQALDAQVVGVSSDGPNSHARFREKHGLTFPLLSDEEGIVIEAYGAKGLFGRTKRITFVIDAGGTVRDRIESLFPGPHVAKSLEGLEARG